MISDYSRVEDCEECDQNTQSGLKWESRQKCCLGASLGKDGTCTDFLEGLVIKGSACSVGRKGSTPNRVIQ